MFKLFTVANESVLNVDVTLVILFQIIITTTMKFAENKSILLHLIVNSSTKENYYLQ